MRRFNIGLIGCGDIATTWHVPTLLASKRVHVSGICDIDAAKMNKLQERCHFETATEDCRELLNRPEIDAVVVTTMPWVTPKITVEALERGKHVLCEKPMAVTTADARGCRSRKTHRLQGYGRVHIPPRPNASQTARVD